VAASTHSPAGGRCDSASFASQSRQTNGRIGCPGPITIAAPGFTFPHLEHSATAIGRATIETVSACQELTNRRKMAHRYSD